MNPNLEFSHSGLFSAGIKAALVLNFSLEFPHVKTGAFAFSSPNTRFGNLPVKHQHTCAQMGGVEIFEACP